MDMYQQVTNSIIAELEKGAIPWVKPWRADASADRNFVSKKGYNGINRLLLGMSAMGHGFTSPDWATSGRSAAVWLNSTRTPLSLAPVRMLTRSSPGFRRRSSMTREM